MFLLVFGLAAILVLICLIWAFVGAMPPLRTVLLFNKLPGPTNYPFFLGVAPMLLKMKNTDLLPWMEKLSVKYNGLFGTYWMGRPSVCMTNPEDIEIILSSNKNIEKSAEYRFIGEWLNNGLLNSTGEHWRRSRKILTPSFHFKILDDSTESMNRNWKKTVEKLLEARGAPVNPLHILGRGALDIICGMRYEALLLNRRYRHQLINVVQVGSIEIQEDVLDISTTGSESAMGTNLDEHDLGEEYVDGVKTVTEDATKRVFNPISRIDCIYKRTPQGQKHLKDISFLKKFTEKVIQERKEAFEKEQQAQVAEEDELYGKKRRVFLDSLLELMRKKELTENVIRQEVDTFMFAGHDTTSTAMQFIFLHLAENPEVQEKAYQEQVDLFGGSDRPAERDDLAKMHYLEQVIKESLRLHPSAPQISRLLTEDVTLHNGMVIPAGCKVNVGIMLLHRNPKLYPDPEAFKPERFSPEESKKRHPYSYLPFSAGPRNCIGQKFAMMEMKIGMSAILRACKLTPVTRSADLKYELVIILKPSPSVLVEITPRH